MASKRQYHDDGEGRQPYVLRVPKNLYSVTSRVASDSGQSTSNLMLNALTNYLSTSFSSGELASQVTPETLGLVEEAIAKLGQPTKPKKEEGT